MLILPVDQKDLECLSAIPGAFSYGEPNMKLSIYKNRRGMYKGIYVWCAADLGTCRVRPLFATTWDYKFVPINNVQLLMFKED